MDRAKVMRQLLLQLFGQANNQSVRSLCRLHPCPQPAIMMKMFSSAVGMFHGKSKTDSPYNHLHQLTAPDIDLKQFNFSSLAGEASDLMFLSRML